MPPRYCCSFHRKKKRNAYFSSHQWLDELRQSGEPDIVVILVGNKVDLVEENPSLREVPYETGANFAQRHG
jgi:GTPase SAR1 family protein